MKPAYVAIAGLLVSLAVNVMFIVSHELQRVEIHKLQVQVAALALQAAKVDERKQFITGYIQKRNRNIGDKMAALMADTFVNAGEEFNIDPLFLVAQAGVESTFKVYAKSNKNAVGIMQVVPRYWVKNIEWLETADDLYNVHANIRAGAYILAHYRGACGGTMENALTCYHGGFRAIKRPRLSTVKYRATVLERYRTLEIM